MQQVCKRTDLDKIVSHLSPNSVLDIGCSTNAFPHATHLIDYVDNSSMYPGKKFTVQDLNSDSALPFDSKSLDFVFCSHVLEHLDDPERLLHEMNRVARSGVIAVPTKLEDNLYSLDAIKAGDDYLTDRYGHKWWFDYGKDSILEISERKRVVRRIPQSDMEIKKLKEYMPNMFELCVYWQGQIEWSRVGFSCDTMSSQVRLGTGDLGFLLRSQVALADSLNDFKERLKSERLKSAYVRARHGLKTSKN